MPVNAITRDLLEEAREKIVTLFHHHCLYGNQTTTLQNGDFAACGQFIGETARARGLSQRGIHGTAAAISVLSLSNAPDQTLIRRLVKYISDRQIAESGATPSTQISSEHFAADDSNVIKVAELLLALSHVPAASVPNVDKIRRTLIDRLKQSLVEGKGWRYFTDLNSGDPEILPTAYAMMALAAFDEDMEGPRSFLVSQLEKAHHNTRSAADVTTRIAVVFALVFYKHAGRAEKRTEAVILREFENVWYQVERQLRDTHVEQNVEYWREKSTFYVRVPWQLYLLAISAKLRFVRRFCTYSSQVRLRAIVSDILSGEFLYPHSGAMVSSRTNAIAHDVLWRIQEEIMRRPIIGLYVWIDWIRSSSWLRYMIGLTAMALACVSLWKWSEHASIKDFAPDIVGSLVCALALWTRRR